MCVVVCQADFIGSSIKNFVLLRDHYLITTGSNILVKLLIYFMNLIIYKVYIRFL